MGNVGGYESHHRHRAKVTEPTKPIAPTKTAIKISNHHYEIELSKIPYLAAYARFEANTKANTNPGSLLVHGPIALFEVALIGIRLGYGNCFDFLPAELPHYHTLCDTYDFLQVDGLTKQSFEQIKRDMKLDMFKARDAAFRLVYLILIGEFKDDELDSNKAYNVVLYVLGHHEIFTPQIRRVVRAAY
ncbi:geranylgeranyl pyrophosphate synthetase [Sclerotinia borealis F-4128]|uniref:Geranylgeranyl pyrophosphate synthetase n=1 Tax=Sclerotinia borealis (strain F-4128) TaxID=1432307 RepID=W9CFF7_SCLBF|nr:geranylgeranyl pyrophosphate synthetase [Sclerotinia borealis F-4128]